MGCDTKTAATVWAPSYERATLMQASLAIVSLLAGTVAWVLGGGAVWPRRGVADRRGRAVHVRRDHADEPSLASART